MNKKRKKALEICLECGCRFESRMELDLFCPSCTDGRLFMEKVEMQEELDDLINKSKEN